MKRRFEAYSDVISGKYHKNKNNWLDVIDTLERAQKSGFGLPASSYYDLGYAYCKLKRWKEAASVLIKAVNLKPDNNSWVIRYAISLQNCGELEKYTSIINRLADKNDTAKKNYQTGILLLGYSRPIEAEKFFREAIRISNTTVDYYLGLAMSLQKQGRSKSWQVVNVLEKAVLLNPKKVEAVYSLGFSYECMNNFYMAAAVYFKALILSSKNTFKINTYLKRLKNTKISSESLKGRVERSPSNNLYSEGMMVLFTEPMKAEKLFRRAIEEDNSNAQFYIGLASSLELQGESKLWQEINALEKAVEIGNIEPSRYFRLGVIQEKMRKYKLAKNNYEIALNQGVENSEIFYRLGYCLEKIGNKVLASECYTNAIKYDKNQDVKKYGIGVIHNRFGRKKLAALAFEEEANNKNDANLFYKIGMAYDRTYNWKKANKAYKRAIRLFKNNFDWQYRLGFTYERLCNYKEASYWYDIASRGRERHTPYWYYRLGYTLQKNNEYKKSCEAYLQYKKEFITPQNYLSEIDNNVNIISEEYRSALNYEINGDLKHALNIYEKLYNEFYPCREDILFRMGCVRYKSGIYSKAAVNFMNMRALKEPHGVSDKNYRENRQVKILNDYNHHFKNSEIKKDSIIYESFHGSNISCNPLAIFLGICNDPTFANYTHFWVVNNKASIPSYFSRFRNLVFIERESDAYIECLATVRILINNSTFPSYFIKKPEQIYINTWHGTPLKTLGKDMKGRFLEHKNFTKNILHSDILLSPNRFTTNVLKYSHDIDGIYEGEIFEAGYPRIDLTLNLSPLRKREILESLKFDNDKKVIFYAPTWRGTHGDVEFNKEKLLSDLRRLSTVKDAHIVFRGHSLLENLIGEVDILGVSVLPKNIDTNEFLGCTDILVTDYSSVFFDFIVTNKPIFYYAYDLQAYKAERGLYLDIEELPGKVCYDIDALTTSIDDVLNFSYEFNNENSEYNLYDDGKATERVLQKIKNLLGRNEKVSATVKNKIKILFYAGPFMRNGITTSFINLVNTLINKEYSITVVVDPGAVSKFPERLEQISKINPKVNVVGRVGGMNFSIEERYVHSERNREFNLSSKEMQDILCSSWQTEFKRIFGNARFDCVINFEGYSNFWSALMACCDVNKKIIYQHNDMHSEMTQKYPYLAGVFNVYHKYNYVVSVSNETRKLNLSNLASTYHVEPHKFCYSENLLNLDSIFSLSAERMDDSDLQLFNSKSHTFISIGRLSIEKDHEKLIRSFNKLLNDNINANLIILGEGPLKSDLVALTKELCISESVHFLGHRLNPYPYIKMSTCFVSSSNHEGQPMTLLEALTLNKDIIATSIPGNDSVLNLINEKGVENSIEGLYYALKKYVIHGKKQEPFNYLQYQDGAIQSFISYLH